MILHTEPSLQIYFGDAKNELYPDEYLTWHENLLGHEQFSSLAPLKLKQLYFLHQVHGIAGEIVHVDTALKPFAHEGDFLITQQSNVGIGVMTADCVPIVLYDKKHHAIAIVHAGWRGAIQGVALQAIKKMQHTYKTNLSDLKLFFGPSAKKCCYQVDPQFGMHLEDYFFGSHYLHTKPSGTFFDLPGFLIQQLIERAGIKQEAIGLNYNQCTICNPIFWSYRRGTQKGASEKVGRQMTVVSLK